MSAVEPPSPTAAGRAAPSGGDDTALSPDSRPHPQRGPICAVINPAAGRGRGARMWPDIRGPLVAAGLDIREVIVGRTGDALDAAERASRDGAEIVVAVGGDGTLNEALNGLMRIPPALRPALAFVPGGTGNIFARALGLPTRPAGLIELLLGGTRRRLDVGRVNERYYATVAGVGFDGELVGRAAQWPRLLGSKPMHVVAFLSTLIVYRSPSARLTIDDRRRDITLTFLAAANTDWYGGGLHIAPGARPDDGALDVVYTHALTRTGTIAVALGAFSGRHIEHPGVTRVLAREVTVDADVPVGIHADGEWLGRAAATIRIVPQALDVMTPGRAD